jgi:hypothetical protein
MENVESNIDGCLLARHEFITRVSAKVAPDDPQEEAVEAKCDALFHAVRAQSRRILARPILNLLDLDARAWAGVASERL